MYTFYQTDAGNARMRVSGCVCVRVCVRAAGQAGGPVGRQTGRPDSVVRNRRAAVDHAVLCARASKVAAAVYSRISSRSSRQQAQQQQQQQQQQKKQQQAAAMLVLYPRWCLSLPSL